jgi:hypothetical protein
MKRARYVALIAAGAIAFLNSGPVVGQTPACPESNPPVCGHGEGDDDDRPGSPPPMGSGGEMDSGDASESDRPPIDAPDLGENWEEAFCPQALPFVRGCVFAQRGCSLGSLRACWEVCGLSHYLKEGGDYCR